MNNKSLKKQSLTLVAALCVATSATTPVNAGFTQLLSLQSLSSVFNGSKQISPRSQAAAGAAVWNPDAQGAQRLQKRRTKKKSTVRFEQTPEQLAAQREAATVRLELLETQAEMRGIWAAQCAREITDTMFDGLSFDDAFARYNDYALAIAQSAGFEDALNTLNDYAAQALIKSDMFDELNAEDAHARYLLVAGCPLGVIEGARSALDAIYGLNKQ